MHENKISKKKKNRGRTTSGGAQTSFKTTTAATSVLYIFYTHIMYKFSVTYRLPHTTTEKSGFPTFQ